MKEENKIIKKQRESTDNEIRENIKRVSSINGKLSNGKLSMEDIINKKAEVTWDKQDENLW